MHMLAVIKKHTKTNTNSNTMKGEKTSKKKVFMGEENYGNRRGGQVKTPSL